MFGLIGGDVPQKQARASKICKPFPVFSLSPICGVRYELQLHLLLCFGSIVMDTKPLKL